MSQCQIIT